MKVINFSILSVQKLVILVAFSAVSSLVSVSPAKADRRTGVSGSSNTTTNVQVDTSGRDSKQEIRTNMRGDGVQTSVGVQVNMSGCSGQNSSQTVEQNRTGSGASASASVSVCNPAIKLRDSR